MSSRASLVLSLVLALSLVAAPATARSSFADVDGSVHEPAVTALAEEGVIEGCDEDRFCPANGLTRAQAASLLARALELDTSRGDSGRFRDTAGSVHEGAIEAIAAAGYTDGCTATSFCPNDPVTRGQLATLLREAFELPAAADGRYFDDIDGLVHEPAIESLADAGVAAGCGHVEFCPGDRLTRAQGATFLARAMELVARVQLAPYDERREQHEREQEQQARAAANAPGQKAVDVALDQLGKPYQYGGNGPNSFDCSGLTGYAWRAAGVDLPRTSRDQYAGTKRISRDQLRPGDLIFYHQPVSHVAMYIGDGRVVESPSSGKHVRINDRGLSRSDITGYGRPR